MPTPKNAKMGKICQFPSAQNKNLIYPILLIAQLIKTIKKFRKHIKLPIENTKHTLSNFSRLKIYSQPIYY